MTTIALFGLSGWFALNMGASGLAPAFGSALGARLVSERVAAAAFAVFVVVGAWLLGPGVAKTLSGGIIPASSFDPTTTLCVLGAANVALLIANLVKMPQSTSWVTVAAIATVGVLDGSLATRTLTRRLLPAWVLLPAVAFVASAVLMRLAYPLRPARFGVQAWFQRHRRWLTGCAVASSCYVALAIGSNNVANAVGPLSASGVVSVPMGLLMLAPVFGIGAAVLRGPARTIARDVVPLGVVAALICNIVVASLLLLASYLGLPQSLVQLNAAAVLAVAFVKEGRAGMFDGRGTRRMLLLWIATPALAAALTALGAWTLR